MIHQYIQLFIKKIKIIFYTPRKLRRLRFKIKLWDSMSENLLPFERRMEMFFTLVHYRKLTRRELAEMFLVSDDVVDRDILLLGQYIPLRIKRGRYGGIEVSEEYYNGMKIYMSTDAENILRKYIMQADESDKSKLESILYKFAMPKKIKC